MDGAKLYALDIFPLKMMRTADRGFCFSFELLVGNFVNSRRQYMVRQAIRILWP